LKMKVRALPTCKKPVGEGAKRTRTMPNLDRSQYNRPADEVISEWPTLVWWPADGQAAPWPK
jgi:hypothetical protein